MSSADHNDPYSPFRDLLLTEARHALEYGVKTAHPPVVKLETFPEALRAKRATFITLEKLGHLRGCIGHLEATQPLLLDVLENTVAAAMEDPRFPPVREDEIRAITISISILTPPEPVPIRDEADLLKQLRPGVDGLILGEGRRRATFLPSVWEELPEPAEFVRQLKRKAGWPAHYWSTGMKADRYQSIYISEKEN